MNTVQYKASLLISVAVLAMIGLWNRTQTDGEAVGWNTSGLQKISELNILKLLNDKRSIAVAAVDGFLPNEKEWVADPIWQSKTDRNKKPGEENNEGGGAETRKGNLYVYDANNQYLGILLGVSPLDASMFDTYLPRPGIFLGLRQTSGSKLVGINNTGTPIYFSSDNCAGNAYVEEGNPGGTILSSTGRAFVIINEARVNGLNSWSRLTTTCENGQGKTSLLVPLREVPLPFTLPLAWPLEVH